MTKMFSCSIRKWSQSFLNSTHISDKKGSKYSKSLWMIFGDRNALGETIDSKALLCRNQLRVEKMALGGNPSQTMLMNTGICIGYAS